MTMNVDYAKGERYPQKQSKSWLGACGSIEFHRDQFTTRKDFQYNLQRPHWAQIPFIFLKSNSASSLLLFLPIPIKRTFVHIPQAHHPFVIWAYHLFSKISQAAGSARREKSTTRVTVFLMLYII